MPSSEPRSASAAVVAWLKELRVTHPVQTAAEERALHDRLVLEPEALRNELVLRNLGPAVVLVRQTPGLKAAPLAELVSATADALGAAADRHVDEVGQGTLFLALVKDEVVAAVLAEHREELRAEFTPSLDAPLSGGRIKDGDELTGLDTVVNRVDPIFFAGRLDPVRERDVATVVACVRRILAEDPGDPGFRLFGAMFLGNLTFDAACARERISPDEAEELLEQTANLVRDRLRHGFGVSGEEAS